jgi:hypothetical protein
MTIRVEHRPDQLLQNSFDGALPFRLRETYIGKVTQPHHKMALKFLDERVVDQNFEDQQALQAVLDTWPIFASENGLEVHRDWDRINLHEDESYIAFRGGMGGPFVIGLIETLTSDQS